MSLTIPNFHRPLTFWIADFIHLIKYSFPKTFKGLSVYEDFNKDLAVITEPRWYTPKDPEDQTGDTVRVWPHYNTLFVPNCFNLNLEELSISYMVNAENFFPVSIPTPIWNPYPIGPWERLQPLTLTSQFFQPTISHLDTNALLCRVGVAALQMHKLRNLALWNGTRGFAAAFFYRPHTVCASITWCGTWNHEFSPEVIEAWQSVALTLHSMGLRIEKELIERDLIESHGDAIHYLDLPCRVVDPKSLW